MSQEKSFFSSVSILFQQWFILILISLITTHEQGEVIKIIKIKIIIKIKPFFNKPIKYETKCDVK